MKSYHVIQDPWNGNRWQVRVYDSESGIWGDAGEARDTQQEAAELRLQFIAEGEKS